MFQDEIKAEEEKLKEDVGKKDLGQDAEEERGTFVWSYIEYIEISFLFWWGCILEYYSLTKC